MPRPVCSGIDAHVADDRLLFLPDLREADDVVVVLDEPRVVRRTVPGLVSRCRISSADSRRTPWCASVQRPMNAARRSTSSRVAGRISIGAPNASRSVHQAGYDRATDDGATVPARGVDRAR